MFRNVYETGMAEREVAQGESEEEREREREREKEPERG